MRIFCKLAGASMTWLCVHVYLTVQKHHTQFRHHRSAFGGATVGFFLRKESKTTVPKVFFDYRIVFTCLSLQIYVIFSTHLVTKLQHRFQVSCQQVLDASQREVIGERGGTEVASHEGSIVKQFKFIVKTYIHTKLVTLVMVVNAQGNSSPPLLKK